jgi:hypothetical protein
MASGGGRHLHESEVAATEHADSAVAPGLFCNPLDRVLTVTSLVDQGA